ncbi:hypothetical protein LLG46_06320 [bacterium]|nr:hypothetical protein [bacterium]
MPQKSTKDLNTDFDLIPLIEDQPIDDLEHDYLGLMPWAKMIAGSVVGTRGPFTIGVHGEWGYGKTTLLKLTKALIDEHHQDVVTVWFNAWQFEREEHPLFPLVAAIADEIEKKVDKNESLEALSKVGASIRALARGMKFSGEVGMPLVGKVGVEFDADKALKAEELIGNQSNPLQGEMMYHSAFEMLEKVARDGSKVKIAVFVDDLDRCQPDKAVFLLESIKLILAQPGFVFVLAVDRRPIEGYLQKRYRDHFDGKEGDWGRFYMEKIIQLPIPIPSHRTRFNDFVKRTVTDVADKHGATQQQIKALLNIQPVLACGAETNPRSLIRLINNFLLDCSLWQLIDRSGDANLSKYQELTQDIAAALAFNRILDHLLGDLYAELINDELLCGAIEMNALDRIGSVESLQNEASTNVHEDDRRETSKRLGIIDKLSTHPELLDALRSQGESWLTDIELRRAVRDFAQTQRATGFSPDFADTIAQAIRKELDIEDGDIIPVGRLDEIENLDLNCAHVTDKDIRQFKTLTGLRVLNLAGTLITDIGLKHIGKLIELQELFLNDTLITDIGLKYLGSLSHLQVLNLGRANITNKGMQNIKDLNGLLKLTIHATNITDEGLKCLGDFTELQSLVLSGNHITNDGLSYLRDLTKLNELVLSDTHINDLGLKYLEKMTRLRHLYLSGLSNVTDIGLNNLVGLSELHILHVERTGVTEKGILELQKKLTQLRIID